MPRFYTDAEVDVDVTEFMNSCNDHEINEVIHYLKQNDFLPKAVNNTSNISINEIEFEDNLTAISGNYLILTKEEEEVISKIAKRFK
jgi:uncharacterized protein YlzI (FlbEa/FlbD family)